ncbi:MAG: flavin reductase family protein [Candidatus Lokiarchaeota archaeon]|nr:flavin reductase family protein [Candidatus Lokiarchaeota archaeon]
MKKEVSINQTLFSMPIACVTVGNWGNANIITLAYVGKVCMNPPVIAIGVHPARYSHTLLETYPEFVLNIPTVEQTKIMDACGTISGRNHNKWELLGLTKEKGIVVNTPLIAEFPCNMECKTVGFQSLGSHTVFFGEIVANHLDELYITNQSIQSDKIDFILYMNGMYYKTEKKTLIGLQGFSKKEK